MKSLLTVVIVMFALASCGTVTPVSYAPNPLNVEDPVAVLSAALMRQPAAYAYLPTDFMVDRQCIKLFQKRNGPYGMPKVGANGLAEPMEKDSVPPMAVCYDNIGRIGLSRVERDNLWRVELDDKTGYYMLWVYLRERSDAERFIDAISGLMQK